MLNDAGQKQKEQLKDDPVGPGEEKLKSDPGAMAGAEAAARPSSDSTREIINREKSVTAKLLHGCAAVGGEAPSASTGGVQMAGVDLPGGGVKDDDTPVEQVERRKDALEDADDEVQAAREGRLGHADPDSGGRRPTRNKARLGLEMAAENADRLGDKVNSGAGDLARPHRDRKPCRRRGVATARQTRAGDARAPGQRQRRHRH